MIWGAIELTEALIFAGLAFVVWKAEPLSLGALLLFAAPVILSAFTIYPTLTPFGLFP